MKMKTYRADNAAAAFAKIKADLGEDAVILSNKTVMDNGRKCCEIVAAIDSTPTPRSQMPSKDDYLGSAMDESLGWRQEWGQIKGHLMALLKPQMNLASLAPRQRLAMEYLEREGTDDSVLLEIYQQLSVDKDLSILPVLDKIAPVRAFGTQQWRNRIQAFAGPNGAGKTSSLIRLALREKKANPKARICICSADATQGKGRMVLKHYAELSGLVFRELVSREDVAAFKAEATEFDLILMDLPGLPGKQMLQDWLAARGLESLPDMIVHLVLNPYYSHKQYEVFANKYKCRQLASVIWTKLDEACTFGAILNMAFTTGLPVSALSFGSGLKNSMTPATKEMVWRLLFKHQLPGGEE